MELGSKSEWAEAAKEWGKTLLGAVVGIVVGAGILVVGLFVYEYLTH